MAKIKIRKLKNEQLSSRLDSLISEGNRVAEAAEKQLQEDSARLKILEERIEPLRQVSTRLNSIGHPKGKEAARVLQDVEAEYKRLSERTSGMDVAVEPTAGKPAGDDPTEEDTETEDDTEVVADEAEAADTEVVDRSPDPVMAMGPIPTPVSAAPPILPITEKERLKHAHELCDEAMNLRKSHKDLDPYELELRIDLVASRLRHIQNVLPDANDNITPLAQRVRASFGTMTAICKEYLNKLGRRVESLNPSLSVNWPTRVHELKDRLKVWRKDQERRDRDLQNRKEKERRERQIRDKNHQVADEYLDELQDLAEDFPDVTDSHYNAYCMDARQNCRLVLFYYSGEQPPDRLIETMRQICAQVPPVRAERLVQGSEFRNLRKKLRASGVIPNESGRHQSVEETQKEPEEPIEQIQQRESNWKGRFKGCTGMMVGGSPREERRKRLENYFGFDKLEWIKNEKNERANTDSLVAAIKNHKCDIFIQVSRFCSHAVQEHAKPACKSADVPFVNLQSGYGRSGICRAMDNMRDMIEESLNKCR